VLFAGKHDRADFERILIWRLIIQLEDHPCRAGVNRASGVEKREPAYDRVLSR
jgi:hypothetical protein